ncbi:unnamed protein product [Polarella glacialis]|uniref:Uncharacterized protein n=1 Tax=Polarella glacialis TaxID=89957 RepID=A0A813FBP0_POLGL|nr:unnamed protein product [Polarella glacialis]
MAGVEDECRRHVIAASTAENEGIELDRAGDVNAAIRKYEVCETALEAAISAALPAHADDQPKLTQHRAEVLDRISHLKSLNGKPSSIPVEQQIRAVQLGMQATSAASAATTAAGGVKTLAAVAALGAAGGFVVLGSTIGLGVVGAVGGAAVAGYAATRSDKVGDLARGAGGLAVKGVDKAMDINREHDISGKFVDAGSKAVGTAKAVNEKYGISDKVGKGVGVAVSKAQQVEEKHNVTSKVAAGLSFGLGKLSSALDSATKAVSSSSSSGAASSAGTAGR